MTTIMIEVEDTSNIQKILDFVNHLKGVVKVSKLTDEQTWVRQQLTEKYVETGEWENMDDEDRQDAALGEMMLYAKMQPDYEIYTESETKSFLTNLKKDLYALSGQ